MFWYVMGIVFSCQPACSEDTTYIVSRSHARSRSSLHTYLFFHFMWSWMMWRKTVFCFIHIKSMWVPQNSQLLTWILSMTVAFQGACDLSSYCFLLLVFFCYWAYTCLWEWCCQWSTVARNGFWMFACPQSFEELGNVIGSPDVWCANHCWNT